MNRAFAIGGVVFSALGMGMIGYGLGIRPSPVYTQPQSVQTLEYEPLFAREYQIFITSIHDGDTITCDIDLGFGLAMREQKVRMADFDAWELTRTRKTVKITDEELKRGVLAKKHLETIFQSADLVTATSERPWRDNYGRLLLTVYTDGKPVVEKMRQLDNLRDDRFSKKE